MTIIPPLAPGAIAPPFSGDVLYELVNGRYVELPPMSTFAGRVATIITKELEVFGETHSIGRAASEILFRLTPDGALRRRPDAAFVSYERWAKDRPVPHTDPWPVVPDLAVEVVSPNDLAEELRSKVSEYLTASVRLVWVIYPRPGLVDVYESTTTVRVLSRTDELDGGTVLPGLRLPLAKLFADAPPND